MLAKHKVGSSTLLTRSIFKPLDFRGLFSFCSLAKSSANSPQHDSAPVFALSLIAASTISLVRAAVLLALGAQCGLQLDDMIRCQCGKWNPAEDDAIMRGRQDVLGKLALCLRFRVNHTSRCATIPAYFSSLIIGFIFPSTVSITGFTSLLLLRFPGRFIRIKQGQRVYCRGPIFCPSIQLLQVLVEVCP
jgi:hypothetical protein